MAKRTSSNVKGDLNELYVSELMLEHGIAINTMTASDTGWDLHCHIPDQLIQNASEAPGDISWTLSGRVAHIQVKSAAKDRLRVGTVRGWLTGTLCGVPTFMFTRQNDRTVFCTPENLDEWLIAASRYASDSDAHVFTFSGKNTKVQTRLAHHVYKMNRFPSVVQLWIRYPQIAQSYPALTSWVNHDEDDEFPGQIECLVQELAKAIWADKGYGLQTSQRQLLQELIALLELADLNDAETLATDYMMSLEFSELTQRDRGYTRDSVESSIARFLDNNCVHESAENLLVDLFRLRRDNAITPSKTPTQVEPMDC